MREMKKEEESWPNWKGEDTVANLIVHLHLSLAQVYEAFII